MESFGNENIAFQIPSDQLIYEGSYRQWPPSLRNPSGNHIDWIIARCGDSPYPDKEGYSAARVEMQGDYR